MDSSLSKVLISWKQKEVRKKKKKQIFGEHYNYNYNKPNQKKMYRIQENRNTEIERSNRILLEKIQCIFKRSAGRKSQVNSETQSSVDISMKLRSHSNNAHNINNYANVMTKSNQNSHENIEINAKMKMKLNDFVQEKLGRSNDKNGKTPVGERGVMGELNKGIQIARESVRDEKVGKGESKMNRKLVKLSEIEEPLFQRRKRIQTEFQIPKTNPHMQSKLSSINELIVKDKITHRPTLIQIQTPILSTVKNSQQNSQRNSNIKHQNHKDNRYNEALNDEYQNIPKIVLHREFNIEIGSGVYDMVMYVEGSSYVVLAVSLVDGDEFKETITMPYRNYQEFYKNSLEENHGNVIKYFKLCDGLLEIQGFDSQFKDLPKESSSFGNGNSQISCEEEKANNRLIDVDEILGNGKRVNKGRVKENDEEERGEGEGKGINEENKELKEEEIEEEEKE